jgi:LVIVD repeat
MKYVLLFFSILFLYSCWKPNTRDYSNQPQQKVWGSKPVYAAESVAKHIQYSPQKHALIQAGNIYAFGKYIFQVDVGRGIHVINNTVPLTADRIGFITVNGCEQISIKGTYLYTNSFADLVTLDISDPVNLREVSRIPNAFPEFTNNYPLIQPEENGYYICPQTDSVVVGWVKDSINSGCYK